MLKRDKLGLDLPLQCKVAQLKRHLWRRLDVSPSKQRLLFRGCVLRDEQTLQDCGVSKECTIQLHVRHALPNSGDASADAADAEASSLCVRTTDADSSAAAAAASGSDPTSDTGISSSSTIIPPTIDPSLMIGNVILVKVLESKDLKHSWTSSSNPYVMVSLAGHSARSKIVKKDSNPHWNELFCLLESPSSPHDQSAPDESGSSQSAGYVSSLLGRLSWRTLSGSGDQTRASSSDTQVLRLSVFAQDRFTADTFLGSADILVSDIPLEQMVDLWLPLSHVDTGHIHVRLKRSPLPSPAHRRAAEKLCSLERGICHSDLRKQGITIDQLCGEEAWICPDLSNPAIEHLVSVILDESTDWSLGSLQRAELILRSQHMLPNRGLPSRHLWFSGLCFSKRGERKTPESVGGGGVGVALGIVGGGGGGSSVSERSERTGRTDTRSLSKSDFLHLVEEYATPKRCYLPKGKKEVAFAMLEFKSVREALLVFVMFQHKRTANGRMLIGFGHRIDHYQSDMLSRTMIAGFLNIYDSLSKEWRLRWCFLTDRGQLHSFLDLHKSQPSKTVDISQSFVISRSSTSVELFDPGTDESVFVYCHCSSEMQEWLACLQHCSVKAQPTRAVKKEMQQTGPSELLFKCELCAEHVAVTRMFCTDPMRKPSCTACLKSEIAKCLGRSDLIALTSQFSEYDLQQLCQPEQLEKFLELALRRLLSESESFVQCPQCGCHWDFSVGRESEAPDFSTVCGLDNRSLQGRPAEQAHYLSRRVVCLQCGTNFCRDCRETPYHCGLDCEMYQLYKNADKCRFCGTALIPGVLAENPPSEALSNVCNSESCLDKRKQSCEKRLDCGHVCRGVRNEKECLCCLEPGCCESASRYSVLTQNSEELCGVCMTEVLGAAPCVQLDCSHVFHLECIKLRLGSQSSSDPLIAFGHTRCPLCDSRISHPQFLSEELSPLMQLHCEIEQKAFSQAREDGFADETGRWLSLEERKEAEERGQSENIVGFSVQRYAYYNCFVCNKAYFGGARRCAAVAPNMNPSDFICPACSGIGLESCEKHGKDYMVYKCRFCCSVATYFCWGTTHFCPDCHHRQESHDYMTTKTREQLPKCPGPEHCPLGLEHPPNGEEFSLGCSLCRGADNFVQLDDSLPR